MTDNQDRDVNFFDLFNPNQPRSKEELIQYRMSICQTCPAFNQRMQRCTKCGCFMKLKTTLQQAKCPIDKW